MWCIASNIFLTALLIVKEAKNFLAFCTTKYTLPCSHGLPLASVLLSMSAGHFLIFHNLKIHINIIVLFTQFSSKLCLHFWNFGYNFVVLFLISYTSHNFSPSRPRHNQLCVYTLSSLANGFQNYFIKYFGYVFDQQNSFVVLPFQIKTITVCLNVCNHLPGNVASYNRRKVWLFISL